MGRRVVRIGRAVAWALALLALLALGVQLTGHGYLWQALRYTYLDGHRSAHIDDARNFSQAPIAAADRPTAWPVLTPQVPLSDAVRSHLVAQRSAAFVVAHRGQLVSETYFAPYHAHSRTNVFSVTKTLTTLLAGAMVAEGWLASIDEPVLNWLPELGSDPRGSQATLAQLAAMTSGHAWDENYYLPLNPTTELYFGGHAAQTVLHRGFERTPGSAFEYSSASSQLLGLALMRVLAAHRPGTSLSDHASRRLWQPLGMEDDASWSLDRPRAQGGVELTYCCVHTSARNLARLGQLMLQRGQWAGQALLPAAFIDRMTTPGAHAAHYGMGVWIDRSYRTPFYFLQGHLGQYVIVAPSAELVVVRLGQTRERTHRRHPTIDDEVYDYLDEGLRMAAAHGASRGVPLAK